MMKVIKETSSGLRPVAKCKTDGIAKEDVQFVGQPLLLKAIRKIVKPLLVVLYGILENIGIDYRNQSHKVL